MRTLNLKAPAKLNLNLHVKPKKEKDKLHYLKLLNCQINLSDEIKLINKSKKIEVNCQYNNICKCSKNDYCRGQKNLIIKTAQALKKQSGNKDLGVEVRVKKNIPPAVGLGGGSADGAAVLKGLNKLWNLKLKKDELLKIAFKLGSDISYCLVGGVCLVTGTGEKVKKLNLRLPKLWLIIIVPNQEKPSTTWVYNNLDYKKIFKNRDKLNKLSKAIKQKNKNNIIKYLYNDFETLIFKKFPEVKEIKNQLLQNNALNAILAGAGLSVVGFFKNKKEAEKAFSNLKKYNKNKKNYKKVILSSSL